MNPDDFKGNRGGPAFPLQSIGPDFAPGYAGMTLRDYFAAKAIQALIARVEDELMRGYEGWGVELGREAYRYADAMLAAREAA